jgi:DNA-binding transcriptional MerR regulator
VTAAEPDDLLSIGAVAAAAGVTVPTIRYYEARGLLDATARKSGRRQYDRSAVRRLSAISTLKCAGFSLDEIRRMLDESVPQRERRSIMDARLAEVRSALKKLRMLETALVVGTDCTCEVMQDCVRLAAPSRDHTDDRSRRPERTRSPNP